MTLVDLVPSPYHILHQITAALGSSLPGLSLAPMSHKSTPRTNYDVNPTTGFAPERPLPRLPDAFAMWEQHLDDAIGCIYLGTEEEDKSSVERQRAEEWREAIHSWPAVSTAELQLRHQQRAHYVLAWLVHLYVHSLPPSTEHNQQTIIIPRPIALPLVEVSARLGMAPVLTFADTVLWNCELVDPRRGMKPENVRIQRTFSGSDDEANFYRTSLAAELRGVEMLNIFNDHQEPEIAGNGKLAKDLRRLTVVIDEVNEIIQSVRDIVDPHVFYRDVRPWFEGSGAAGPGSPAWAYQGVRNPHKLLLDGPSAGQSSCMHALDIFLDVDHKLLQPRLPPPTDFNLQSDLSFMDRMRLYMPGHHQAYLNNLNTVRDLAKSCPELYEPYNSAVMALKRLRDFHMRIAVLYIVTMSRKNPGTTAGCPVAAAVERERAKRGAGKGSVRGTGGNEVSKLLKAGRDATVRTML